MTTERRKYTEEFKREAVRLMESSGKPIAELARDLGVNDSDTARNC
jgi:transposase